ncbi:MAG: GumC family protein [Bacteroidales bacterium]
MNKENFADYDNIAMKQTVEPESALFADALTILLRHSILFSIVLIISLVLGYVYIRTTPKMYMRTTTILMKDSKNSSSMMESQVFNDMIPINSNSTSNEIGILRSRRLMYIVAERLKLNTSYRAINLKKTELYSSSPIKLHFIEDEIVCNMMIKIIDPTMVEISNISTLEDTILRIPSGRISDTPLGKIYIEVDQNTINKSIGMEILVNISPIKSIANGYSSALNINTNGDQSSIINISIIDENYTRAEDILNTLIEVYNEDALGDKNKIMVNTERFIDQRLKIIEKELGSIDSQIEDYKKNNRLTDLSSESNVFLNNSNRLDNDALSIDNQINMADYIKSYLKRNSRYSELIPSSIGIQDNGIQKQISEYNEIASKRNRLLTNSSERSPIIAELNSQLESHKRALLRSLDNLQASLRMQANAMKAKEQENYDKITNLPTLQKYIISIERQQKTKEELYLYLLNKKEENELKKTIAESNCKVIDVADGPFSPVSPNKIQTILISLIMGLGIPSLWIYMRMMLNTKVYTKEDITSKLSIPFLGELPFDKQKKEEIIVASGDKKHEHISEALRIIRENLTFMGNKEIRSGRVVQLISFNPESGKTFITTNLAASIALSNSRVIALDLDLRKASFTRRLSLGIKEKGISNYLAGDIDDVETIIRTIDIPTKSFDIIPAGIIPPNPAELLKSDRLEKLIEKLKEKYDYILFDNPPYGLVVDAFVCSRLADHSIYVIRSGMFDKRLFPDLQELYDSKKMRHLSIILNGVDYKKMAYSYRYNYGYGYNPYYEMGSKKKSKLKNIIYKLINVPLKWISSSLK